LCVGSLYTENGAGCAVVNGGVRSHLVVDTVVTTLVEKIEILVSEKARAGESRFRAHGVVA
jgi:hypothetical protein